MLGLMGSSGDAPEAHESGGASGGAGNRWPREETLALLKIRSEMEATFRDSNLKAPLWEQVSRKMAELGFQRSAKKCREKFENVYKYHKRTKDNKSSKSDGKTYRFFDQIQALETITPPPPPSSQPPVATTITSPPLPMSMPNPPQTNTSQPSNTRVLSTSTSSTSSDEHRTQIPRGKKRKWTYFFRKIVEDVIHKQEELQKKFLDTLETRDKARLAIDEARRLQEIARLNHEHDLLVQERSIAAAKDATLISFLQKVTEQQNLTNHAPLHIPKNTHSQPPAQPPVVDKSVTISSSSRWPKAEIETLIKLRTSLELKYQENGPKGPLWEEMSIEMGKFGYSRSSKRCKEKWENINKYYKKVKESNKKRPEDSKTCPYFEQLDAIYTDKAKSGVGTGFISSNVVPIMARPEQQWPVLDDGVMHDGNDRDTESEGDDGDEEDEGGGGNEVVANT